MLRDSNLSVKEIQAHVGYRHAANFAKEFLRHFGQYPSDWRKSKNHQSISIDSDV